MRDLPIIMLASNDALATCSSTPAWVFSFDMFSKMNLKRPLFLLTRPFLVEDWALVSFVFVPWPFKYLTEKGWQNSRSALNSVGL